MAQLRELKKQQTRRTISHVATGLFIERGFERTTIADIAAAAGVSKMTVTNYFPRKEDLFFDAADEVVAWPAQAIAAREAGESALEALCRLYLDAAGRHEPLLGRVSPGFARLMDESPALRARLREIYDQQEQALAGALAEVTDGPDGLEPRLAAAQLASVLRVLMEDGLRRSLRDEDEDAFFTGQAAAAEWAFGLLSPALSGYAVR